jgi:16S rRNA (adenine1518-N6/adenine1519-N6)-dimethyltransferase
MRLKKSLSQVFLTNRSYLGKISRSIDVKDKIVVEGGPGSGRMTEYLLNAKKLYCVELDERMCVLLKEKFNNKPNIAIIQKDILDFDISVLGEKVVFYSNIPYSISKKIIEYLIAQRSYLSCAYILCQKEFAAKLTAKPNDDGYGLLSCSLQYYANVRKLLDVPRVVFSPLPNVDSTLIELAFKSDYPLLIKDEARLMQLLQRAFTHQRKQIGTIFAHEFANGTFEVVGIDHKLRPGEIPLTQYISLVKLIK